MKPVIVLAFSNDRDNYLPMINRERKNIYKTLQNHHDKGFIQVHKEETTSIEDIFELFIHYKDQIVIFHYGGHADDAYLQLETIYGYSEKADAVGLAQLMGQQSDLQLVFLNGCATQKQVSLLLSADIKAVIATSVSINDKMAVEFAEQFYNALANQETIQEAFDIAKAFVRTKYGPSRKIEQYEGLAGRGEEGAGNKKVPWGLYINEKNPEVAGWKLPETSRDSIIVRGSAASFSQKVQVNDQLIETLFNKFAQYNTELNRRLSDYKKDGSMNIRDVRQVIMDSLPSPVGEQLRLLLASKTVDVKRLNQLVNTYTTIIELLCFSMLSQLWEAKYENPKMVIADDYLVEFNSFFALASDSYQKFDYIKLIEAIARIFEENNIKCFIEEINTLGKCFSDESGEFCKAHYFMEEMKAEIIENSVRADEIESFCVQAEEHLGTILSQLAFFVKYKLTTIKRIEIIKHRHKDPKYRHNRVMLDRVTAGVLDEVNIYDSYAENNSVIILKGTEDVAPYLSLSPFIIDENALTGDQNSKIFFYIFQDISNGSCCYNYKFVDNEAEKLTVSETKYPYIMEQFEEFKINVFK